MAIVRYQQLLRSGYTPAQVRRFTASRTHARINRGVYASQDAPVDVIAAHPELVAARIAGLHVPVVASHMSAAIPHGLPVWRRELRGVELSRHCASGGRTVAGLTIHATKLPPDHTLMLGDIPATSLARTVVDLARSPLRWTAISAADAALAAGTTREQLLGVLTTMHGWRGVQRARSLIDLSDPASESPGESVSRLLFHEAGLPTPQLQREIRSTGTFIARVDFYWPAANLVGEFDGLIKYGGTGPDASQTVIREKLREDALRQAGYRVIRWTMTDLARPDALFHRLRVALAGDR